MRILLASHVFAPSLGGIETISRTLAEEFTRLGHNVTVVTQTRGEGVDNYAFMVVRRPRLRHLLSLTRRCDVYFQNNVSLQTAWAPLVARRPWVVTHQTWITRTDGALSWQDQAKRVLLKHATGISISRAIAEHAPAPSIVIGNCYDDGLFRIHTDVARDTDLAFLGRLVSDKGADVLLRALGLLQAQGRTPRLTVIGDGPERGALEDLAQNLHIDGQVRFVGADSGPSLVRRLNAHNILVVPSLWAEPFGIVALEGAACGCVVAGSEQGGLKDAIGPCGVTFPNGDPVALAQALSELLADPSRLVGYRAAAPSHLARHAPAAIADAYLKLFEEVVRR